MAGHVFVIQGSLAHLDYDAVIVPTDQSFSVLAHWSEVLGVPVRDEHCVVDNLKPGDWANTRHGRACESAGGTAPLKPTWFIDATWDDRPMPAEALSEVTTRLTATLREVGAAKLDVDNRRPHRLVALPTLGTGAGGFDAVRGEVIDGLLKTCQAAVDDAPADAPLDIVIVARHAANYTAFQARRRELSHHRSHLGDELYASAERLAERAGQGELALFLGAGVGIAAGLPTWKVLLQELGDTARVELDDLNAADLGKIGDIESALDKAELLRRELGDRFGDEVVRVIGRATRYAITHSMLASLGCAEVVTTNYDQLYEKAAGDIAADGRIVTLPFDQIRARTPWILKMHGDIREPGSIVLTRSDFVSYDAKSRPLGSVVQSLMITKHLLVVGASMGDDNFLRLAHEVFAFRAAGAKAAGAGAPDSPIGTVVTLAPQRIKARLWKDRFNYVPVSAKPQVPQQARDLAIFLDLVAMLTAGNAHLLDKRYASLLGSDAERDAAESARALAATIDGMSFAVARPWTALRGHLRELGAG